MGVAMTKVEVARGFEDVLRMDAARVRSIFNDFEEICPTPALWETAFGELLDCFDTEDERSRAFSAMDANNDGLVDARELLGALAVLCEGHIEDRMQLLFDVFDMNKDKEMVFDEVFMMMLRTVNGLRNLTGITIPPEPVMHSMVKQIWKIARKHIDIRISPDDWKLWWTTDSTMRNMLQMFTRRPEDLRGLPTPDKLIFKDYTQCLKNDEKYNPPKLAAKASGAQQSPRQEQERNNPEEFHPSRPQTKDGQSLGTPRAPTRPPEGTPRRNRPGPGRA